jgi:hypothetical protein
MKLTNKHINEKFTEHGDPIKDMGIGVITIKFPITLTTSFKDPGKYIYMVGGLHDFRFMNYRFIGNLNDFLKRHNIKMEIPDPNAKDALENTFMTYTGTKKDIIDFLKVHYHYNDHEIENKLNESKNIYTKNNRSMRAKKVEEAYGAGFSMSSGGRFSGGLGGTTRGGFGGASNLGGSNMMYTYEIKPLNHTLEQLPTVADNQPEIQIGSMVTGEVVKSNATPDKKKIKGYVRKIVVTDNGAIKYYVVQDEATQTFVKVDPLTITLIIPEPVQYYVDATDTLPSRRKEKLKAAMKEGKIVRESL